MTKLFVKILAVLGIAALIALLVRTLLKRISGADDRLPPGSMGLPLIGETFSFLKNPHKFFETHFERYGPVFKTRIGRDSIVCFVGPEAFTFFMDKPYFNREGGNPGHIQELFYHDSLPLIDGEKHAQMRGLVMQAFRPEALAVYLGTIEQITQSFLRRWENLGSFQWIDEYKRFSASVCDSLLNGAEPGINVGGFERTLDSFTAGLSTLPINLPFTTYGKSMSSRNRLLSIIDDAVRKHRQHEYGDMLAEMMNAKSEDGAGLSNAQLHAQTLHMYFAIYGGLFRTLSLLCMDLALHPDVMERARDEVMRYAPDGALDVETLGKLTYLDQVTREVRRHNRILATTNFDVVEEPFEYQGYQVPKGWKAVGGIYTTMQIGHVFTQPQNFDPDRFNAERVEDLRHENSYIPQGGGSMEGHRCPGEDLTTIFMKAVAVHLLRGYSWELHEKDVILDDEASPMPADGLMVDFRRREASTVEQGV